ncbi:MAG: 30S ribosomal protein S8 [Candidatus Pacebacteria bacterium]|nr:30S ribosomal protein S8 [Candidatus Paceibacterota bacterium]
MTDPIADMLNQIKNAQAVNKPTVEFPYSNLKFEISKILEKNNFIEKVEKKGRKTRKFIELTLKYQDKKGVISGLERVSKPGQRIYAEFSKIGKVKGGYGFAIISTSRGLMTAREARKEKLGGELLCNVW